MTKSGFTSFIGVVTGGLACAILTIAMAASALAKDKPPEVSSDGLHLVKNSKARVAYVKPGASFDKYIKVKILDCYVQFKKNWQRDYNLDEVGLSGRVTDKDAEAIKKRLAAEFSKEFTKVLSKNGHEVVTETADDVLLLRPALINVEVNAPDTMSANFGRTFVASAGQMTLYLELYDSKTSTLLARVIDPQAGDSGGIAMNANRVTNRAEADRILNRWAKLLSDRLGEMKQAN